MANWWNQFGSNYDEINKNLGGLPDFISSRAKDIQPEQEQSYGGAAGAAGLGLLPGAGMALPVAGMAAGALAAPAAVAYGVGKLVAPKWTDETVQKVKDWIGQKLNKPAALGSAYATGMAESVPGSRFLESKLPPETQDLISQIKQQHPLIAGVGRAAGTVGTMAIPGANIVKGAGLAGAAANAAINAAPFAVGTGLDVGATTGNVGQGIKAGLISEGLGTALPTAIGGLAKIPAVNRFLAKMQLAGAGIRSDPIKVLRTQAKSLGMKGGAIDTFVAKHSDDLINNAADLVDKFGPGRAGKDAIKEWNSSGFEAHEKLYEGVTGNKITPDDFASVKTDSDLDSVRGLFSDDEINKAVDEVGNQINGQGWSHARNDILNPQIKAGNVFNRKGLAANDPRILKSIVAGAWHDHIDSIADHAMEWARAGELGPEAAQAAADVPSLHLLKATYPATLAVTKAGAREAGGISQRFAGGSDTAARALLGIGLGGGAAALGVPDMIQNPENIPQDLAKIAMASIGGRLLNRGAGRLAEMGTGALAGMARKGLGMNALTRLSGQSGELMNGSQGLADVAGQQQQEQGVPAQAAPLGAQPIPNATAGGVTQQDIEALGGGPAPVLTPQQTAQVQQVSIKEGSLPPEQVQQASSAVSNVYQDKIRDLVYRKWSNWQNPYKMDFDSFLKQTADWTNGFDPKNENTARIIGGPNYKDYLKSYQVALNLQSLGKDLGEAISVIPGGMSILSSAEARNKHTQLVNTLYTAMTGDMKEPDKTTRNSIETRLNLLRKEHATAGSKKEQLLQMLQNEYGVRFDMLKQYGLF